MREDYLIAMANLVNGSLLGYEDRSSIPQYKKDIEDYVDSLEKVNKEYKEVIDKEMLYINSTRYSDITGLEKHSIKEFWFIKELLDILKGVE